MELTRVGFFRELVHGAPEGPSLHDALRDPLAQDVRSSIARYLQGGTVVLATSATTTDAVEPSRGDIGNISIKTDGTFVWPSDLAYYVATYGARTDPELESIATHSLPRPLGRDELSAVVRALRGH
jgi:hypothetical protein